MAFSEDQARRLNAGIELLLQRLNGSAIGKAGSGYTPQDVPFRICKMAGRYDIGFGISHRAPVGQRHHNGQKWITYEGPSLPDCELIAQTSQNPGEIADAFHRCIFEGIRPMRLKTGQLVDEAAINKIVNERLRVLLDEKIAELTKTQAAPSRIDTPPSATAIPVAARIEAAEAAEAKAWEPTATPQLVEPDSVDSMRLIDIWTKRAAEMGLPQPKLAKGGRIDGRWMRNAIAKWKAHSKPQPAAQ